MTPATKAVAAAVKLPTTCPELMDAANLPYSKASALISQADPALVNRCFSAIYHNFGYGYMHASDHKAALVILLGREPTFREVQDSYHLTGSRNIDAARVKSGTGADNRPTGWPDWNEFQRKVAVLTHLYGASRGGRIADGKVKDPDPEKTRALMTLWSLGDEEPDPGPVPVEPVEPKDPPVTPPVDPFDPAADDISIEIHLTVAGKKRIYRTVEIK